MPEAYYVYIMANKPGGTLYVGVTNDVIRRAQEHRDGIVDSFTKRHQINRLVYYETYEKPLEAIMREKQLKHYNRAWKIRLIKTVNPMWRDLIEFGTEGTEA
jgi:putative endonuclease